jgi:Tol biopolymer transport system component
VTRDGRSPREVRERPVRDPYGLLPGGLPVAAVLSIAGLLVIAVATLAVSNGTLPFTPGGGGTGPQGSGNADVVTKTPTPPSVVVVPQDPAADVPGTIVYAKDGNIWLQSGKTATQLTNGGTDAMPSFSPDGSQVYFVRTRKMDGWWTVDGVGKTYRLDVPALMRIAVTGGAATKVFDGLVDPPGRRRWNGFIRDPAVSPDGKTIAMATDLPDPTRSDVVLKLLNVRTGRVTDPKLSQQIPLGHQDPAWRPDGAVVLFVRNDRDGAKGTPRIYQYNPKTKKSRTVSGPGYLHPAWSPDGKYIAATKTSAFGTDVVILNAATGAEVLRLTSDGESWAPTWSPRGDAVAYLHVSGQVVDLRMVRLEGTAPSWTAKDPLDLTTNAGLDGVSRPYWFIPGATPPATPSPAAPSSAP